MPKQSRLKRITQTKPFFLLCVILLVLVITYIVNPGAFVVGNLKQILSNLSYIGVFLCGISCLLMSGGFDFSASAQASCAMLIFAKLLSVYPTLPWPVALLAAMLFGVLAGSINAFFTNVLNLMPFIATIGMSSVWSGLASWYTRGNTIPIRNQSFTGLSSSFVFGVIPVFFVFMVVLVVLYSIMLRRTKFGRSILMVGGNPVAARLAGLNPKKVKSLLFINNSVLAAIGGLVWASQQRMGSPTGLVTLAPDMTSLTASILGGVSFMGGSGSITGAFCGIILINVLAYALQVMGLPLWVITFVNGSLLVVAITIDNFNMKRRFKKLGIKNTGGGARMSMPGMSK